MDGILVKCRKPLRKSQLVGREALELQCYNSLDDLEVVVYYITEYYLAGGKTCPSMNIAAVAAISASRPWFQNPVIRHLLARTAVHRGWSGCCPVFLGLALPKVWIAPRLHWDVVAAAFPERPDPGAAVPFTQDGIPRAEQQSRAVYS